MPPFHFDPLRTIVDFGLYAPIDAYRLKYELINRGIPVQLVYPGTNIGVESTGHAGYTALTVLVPATALSAATAVRQRLHISPLQSIPPLLITRIQGLINRYLIGIALISYATWLAVDYFSLKSRLLFALFPLLTLAAVVALIITNIISFLLSVYKK